MHYNGIIDIDEESHPFLSIQRRQVRLLQLSRGIDIGLEGWVCLQRFVVQCFAI